MNQFSDEQKNYLDAVYVKKTDCDDYRKRFFEKFEDMNDDIKDIKLLIKALKRIATVVGVPVTIYILELIIEKFISF